MEGRPGRGAHLISLLIEDRFELHDAVKGVLKAPEIRGRRRGRIELFSGAERRLSSAGWVDKLRMIDRNHDVYHERVVDEASGEIIREVTEPLHKHLGHGSAKPKTPG